MKLVLRLGDCVERMAEMPDASVDAVVCDPPYNLAFMGRDWDTFGRSKPYKGRVENPKWAEEGRAFQPGYSRGGVNADVVVFKQRAALEFQASSRVWLREARRVLVPGGVVKAFGGSRTYHRLAAAMEDEGFDGVSIVAWGYGSGFPKSLDVSKAIDKHWGRYMAGEDGDYLQQDMAERVTALKQELRRLYDASGKSRSQIDAECGFRASNYLSAHEPGKRPDPWFFVLPSAEKWEVIKRVLGLEVTHSFDEARSEQAAAHHRLNELFKGAERAVVGYRKVRSGVAFTSEGPDEVPVTVAATPESAAWEGWGTALKPSWEPVVVGHKPVGCSLPPGGLS